MNLKEETVQSSSVFKGALLKVYRDTIRLPDRSMSIREWIDHPGASAVIPLFDDRSTILVRQFRYAVRDLSLEVPAGKIDREGESPEEVALRELEEETGWRARELTHLQSLFPAIGYSNEVIHFYLARHLSEHGEAGEDDEFVQAVRLPFEEALEMARRGDIRDQKSVVALFLAELQLRKEESGER